MIHSRFLYRLLTVICLFVPLLTAGCTLNRYADNLSMAILNQNDPETVRSGAPAYLILVDSFIEADPDDEEMLSAGARLYATYASVFGDDPQRVRLLTERARDYGRRALCQEASFACGLEKEPFEEYEKTLQCLDKDEIEALYAFTLGWLSWMQSHADHLEALADWPKVEAALKRLVALDETYDHGSAHLYLGILKALRPPSLGGKPEEAREHFERALELSGGRNLSVKVAYARTYARLVYDRELHDKLLNEVLAAPIEEPGLVLGNTLAQREAKDLLSSADDYF